MTNVWLVHRTSNDYCSSRRDNYVSFVTIHFVCTFGNQYMTCITGITVWLGLISINNLVIKELKLTFMNESRFCVMGT